MSSGIWKLTTLGRKRAGSIYSGESRGSVISYLYDLGKDKTASVEELVGATGKSSTEVRTFLRGMERQGLAEQVGGR